MEKPGGTASFAHPDKKGRRTGNGRGVKNLKKGKRGGRYRRFFFRKKKFADPEILITFASPFGAV